MLLCSIFPIAREHQVQERAVHLHMHMQLHLPSKHLDYSHQRGNRSDPDSRVVEREAHKYILKPCVSSRRLLVASAPPRA